jgi:long-subunit acyl-CoA synthetase (AMP-forming)
VLEQLANEDEVDLPPRSQWNADPWVRRLLSREVDQVNERRARYEAIRKFAIVTHGFVEASGEKTPTGKFRRDTIAAARMDTIAELYAESAS